MKICIRQKLCPFSHQIGASCLLPNTHEIITAYPHYLMIGDLSFPLSSDPYAKSFTFVQDLEKDCVHVYIDQKIVTVQAQENGIQISIRNPGREKKVSFFEKKLLYLQHPVTEKLHLGSHKKLNWDLLSYKLDVQAMLPSLYMLCQKVPQKRNGLFLDLGNCLQKFYRMNFSHIHLLKSSSYQALFEEIRKLFVIQDQDTLTLLPNCPFPFGRMCNVQTPFGTVDFLWSQKKLQKVRILSKKGGVLFLKTPQLAHSFRYTLQNGKKTGKNLCQQPLDLPENEEIWLDRFFQ